MIAKQIAINWHSDLSIYASEPFLKTVGDEYGWICGFEVSGKQRCILPYVIIKKGIFRMARFRIETIALENELNDREEKLFLNNVMDLFRSFSVDMVMPASTNTIFHTYPDGADVAPYGTYIIDLTQQEETLWSNLHSKHRNVIRKAMKEGVKIRSGLEYSEIAYETIRDTLKRSGLGFMSYKSFNRFVINLKNDIKIFVAEYNNEIQGCAVIPFSNYSAYYLYGGSIVKPVTGANNLLQWEAICQFRNLGVQLYDFVGVRINPNEGSKQKGIMTFKKRFGGYLSNGFIWKYSIRPLKYNLYNHVVKMLRGGDIVDLEKHKMSSDRKIK